MGQWWYERKMCRAAWAKAWTFSAGKLAWGLLVLAGSSVTTWALLTWLTEAPWGERLTFASISGLAGVVFATAVVWLWNLARAPYLRDRKQQEDIAALKRKLGGAVDLVWDEGAVGTMYKGTSPDAQRGWQRNHYSANFWVYARKPIPQPTRLQLRLTKQPKFWAAYLYDESEGGLIVATSKRKSKSLRVKLKGRCLEIEFSVPALSSTWGDGEPGQLFVLARAASPIDIASAAAAFPKPLMPPAGPPPTTDD